MLRELSFTDDRKLIEQFRRDCYKGTLNRVLDDFDEKAHHFALFDEHEEIQAMARILRSDEVQPFELFLEPKAQGLALPTHGLGLESSRVCAKDGSAGTYLLRLCLGVNDYAVRSRADYLIAKTVPHLLPIYLQFGFKVFGEPFISDWFSDNRTVFPIMYRWDNEPPAAEDDSVFVW
ncbi:hypothetical protein [Prosthecobacter sp.]|uniref:hypothetical protein n=1 Tax=Prosthecobacter sp. TaxID=1965333 RepID=UPI002AB92A75|nr:hypothetical protein [Prosthecobacter sp.]MDZ4404907.1 hypothetical protein [Prosthecobacter sp.]